jgi:hypothetical protein
MNELEQDGNKMAKDLIDIFRKVVRKQKIKKIFNEENHRPNDK